MSCIYLGETNTQPAPLEHADADKRYHVVRQGLRWHVRCGSGARATFKSFFRVQALRVASELNSAFLDGRFVGRFNKLPLNR